MAASIGTDIMHCFLSAAEGRIYLKKEKKMVRKNLLKTVCALSAAIIALSSVPVAAEEIITPSEQVQEDNANTVDETRKKAKHKKHKKSEISETEGVVTDETSTDSTIIKKKPKKEKKTEVSEDGTVTEKKAKKSRKPGGKKKPSSKKTDDSISLDSQVVNET